MKWPQSITRRRNEYRKVLGWLTAQGFAVKPPDKYNLSVFASGTVAQIEKAFGTKLGGSILEASNTLPR